eukprot:350740-Rhodomonas_salina.2
MMQTRTRTEAPGREAVERANLTGGGGGGLGGVKAGGDGLRRNRTPSGRLGAGNLKPSKLKP